MSDPSVSGMDDRWILLARQTDEGQPLVVLARVQNPLADTLLRDGIITVVRCVADAALVSDSGMPDHTARLYPVEEALAQAVAEAGVNGFHIASITGAGARRIIFAHAAPLDFAPLIRPFAVEGYALAVAEPEDRAVLIDRITPTPLDRQRDADRQVIAQLEKNGDDGAVPRKVDFWFYGEKPGLDGVVAALAPAGYAVDHWLDDRPGVVLTIETPVDYGTFSDSITPALVEAAEAHGVDYDGWETFVIRPPADDAPRAGGWLAGLRRKLFR